MVVSAWRKRNHFDFMSRQDTYWQKLVCKLSIHSDFWLLVWTLILIPIYYWQQPTFTNIYYCPRDTNQNQVDTERIKPYAGCPLRTNFPAQNFHATTKVCQRYRERSSGAAWMQNAKIKFQERGESLTISSALPAKIGRRDPALGNLHTLPPEPDTKYTAKPTKDSMTILGPCRMMQIGKISQLPRTDLPKMNIKIIRLKNECRMNEHRRMHIYISRNNKTHSWALNCSIFSFFQW